MSYGPDVWEDVILLWAEESLQISRGMFISTFRLSLFPPHVVAEQTLPYRTALPGSEIQICLCHQTQAQENISLLCSACFLGRAWGLRCFLVNNC